MQLVERDRQIIQLVHRHRFLRSHQIIALIGGSPQQVTRRLQLLFHHGYLERPRAQLQYYERGGSRSIAYGLGNKGGALLKRELGIVMRPVTWGEKNRSIGGRSVSARKPPPGDFRRILESLSHRHDTRSVFDAFNRTACDMAFINTTLWGIPTRIIHGNSLSLEYWAAWSNIHYIAPWLPYAQRNQTPEAMEQGQPPKPAEAERIKASLGQQELVF
jgi:DNA-binding Lrp family transcriptional regulator